MPLNVTTVGERPIYMSEYLGRERTEFLFIYFLSFPEDYPLNSKMKSGESEEYFHPPWNIHTYNLQSVI